MSHISFRVSENERILMEGYARVQGVSLSEAIKETFFEKMDDEYDMQVIREHKEEKAKGGVKYFSHKEIKKEIGLS